MAVTKPSSTGHLLRGWVGAADGRTIAGPAGAGKEAPAATRRGRKATEAERARA